MTKHRTAHDDGAGLFGKRLGDHSGMVSRSLLQVSKDNRLALAVTRLTCKRQDRDMTASIAPEAAFSVSYRLADVDELEFWSDGRRRYVRGFGAGTINAIDLSDDPRSRISGTVDTLQFYMRKEALDEIAAERGARPIKTLRSAPDTADPVMGALCQMLMAAPPELVQTNQFFVDQIAMSLLTYFAETYGGMRPPAPSRIGGLAPWQERRAHEIMQARIAIKLTIADVARECGLSPSYFARAFRQSTGVSPHHYLSKLRVEEAKSYLRNSPLSLADIAIVCGFGDQSYMTRVFTRSVGTSPAAWRRAMRN
jgi:AraC family transcriptional regulator